MCSSSVCSATMEVNSSTSLSAPSSASTASHYVYLVPTHHHRTEKPSAPSTPPTTSFAPSLSKHTCHLSFGSRLCSSTPFFSMPGRPVPSPTPPPTTCSTVYGLHPPYDHLRTFGCLCYPNTYATTPHKLAPRSVPCVLLGLPLEHKGHCCLDLTTRKVFTSRHVVFDETVFPFAYATHRAPPAPSAANPAPAPSIHLGSPAQPTSPRVPQPTRLPASPHSPPATRPVTVATPPQSPSTSAPAAATPDVSSPACMRADPGVDPPTQPASPCSPPGRPLPPRAVPVQPPKNVHTMRTRAKHGFLQPKNLFDLSVTTTSISPIPTSYKNTLRS